jgi:hypothetical protein
VPGNTTFQQSRALRWLAGAIVVAVLVYLVPLVHVVPLESARKQAALTEFDAAGYVRRYWDRLRETAERAPDATGLLAALRQDFAGTADRLGHRLGLGGKISFFVSGTGHVVAVNGRAVELALEPNGPAEIVIRTGPLFGNAVRDGSGLFDVSDFANVQHFNAISAEINRRIEADVLPLLEAHAEIGSTVRFAGAVELADNGEVPDTVTVVPVEIETP